MNQHTSFLKRAVTLGVESVNNVTQAAIRDACRTRQTDQLDDCVIYTSCEPCP